MTTYKEIKGTNIEVLESDPSNPLDGQVWYNSTDNVLRGNVGTPVVAWSTVNSLNQARTSTSGAGIATAAIVVGGYSSTYLADTEVWNGANWTEVNNLNTARSSNGSMGTYTAALTFGGSKAPPPPGNASLNITETWNGTNWTEVNDLNSARRSLVGAGTNTAGLAIGGNEPPGTNKVESWNGTNWTKLQI